MFFYRIQNLKLIRKSKNYIRGENDKVNGLLKFVINHIKHIKSAYSFEEHIIYKESIPFIKSTRFLIVK